MALIDAGANIDSRMNKGSTPLYLSACLGRLEAVRVFFRVTANFQSGAHEGDKEALEAAAHMNHEDIVALLCDFGVVDTAGVALCAAIEGHAEACVKLLMRRRGGHADIDARAYINIAKPSVKLNHGLKSHQLKNTIRLASQFSKGPPLTWL